MQFRTLLLTAAAVVTLGACQSNQDPAQGGFFSGISNLSNGTYDNRIKEREEKLENAQDTNLQQTRTAERVAAQSSDVQAERQKLEARYSAMQSDLNTLRKRLASAEKSNSSKAAKAAALQKEIDALAAKTQMLERDTFTPDAAKQARLDALRGERSALEREVDLLVGK
jgi:predicted  nucleic acid-binding Zn-ribbon protein